MLTSEQLDKIAKAASVSLDTYARCEKREVCWERVEEAETAYHEALPEDVALQLIAQARLAIRAVNILREVNASGVEMTDEHISYSTLQVDNDTLTEIAALLTEADHA